MGKHTGLHRLPPAALQYDGSDLQLSLDAMVVGVVILDPGLNIALVNRTFLDLWNMTPPQAPIGGPFRALIDTHRHAKVYDIRDEEWDDYVDGRLEEIRKGDVAPREVLRLDGRTIVYSVTSLSGGKRLVSYRDITEAKRREAELEEARRSATLAEQVKSTFLASIGHGIRTPINGVLGMAELLGQSDLDPRQKTFVEIIVKSGNALLTIINDILDFSRIDTGQIELRPAAFSLAGAIADAAALVGARAREKNLELIVRVQPDLHGHYVGDVGRFRQMLANLLDNALKFTESGHVLVDTGGDEEGDESVLHVAVTDTGVGIPAEKIGVIFDRFSRIGPSPIRPHEGTGLGLAITSGLAALMGGGMTVESSEGQGSTFRFTIRLPRAAKLHKAQAMPAQMSGARILVVDDNAVHRSVLMEQMAGWGFDACAAKNGEEGLAVLKAMAGLGLRPDCLVLDCQMPGMTGAEMARIVRATPQIALAPIIMLTCLDRPLGPPGYHDLAIDHHLVKPACASALLEALVSTIHRNRNGAAPDDRKPRPQKDLRIAGGKGCGGAQVDVLVAEDNEVNQLVFRQILGEAGLTCEIVGDGGLAVEAWAALKPRLVLMDLSLPGMDGLEATAQIRRAEAAGGRRVPIVGVISDPLKGDDERCIEAGMDDCLSKPVSPDALAQKIERWLGHTQAGRRPAG